MKIQLTVYEKKIDYEGRSFYVYSAKKKDGTFTDIKFVKDARDHAKDIDFPKVITFDSENAFLSGRKDKSGKDRTTLCITRIEDVAPVVYDDKPVLEFLGF